jgi:hypothetical protein
MEPEFFSASFHTRKIRSPWGHNGPKPHSLVKIKPDCYGIGIRMRLPNRGQVVMPLGRLSSTSTT